MTNVEDSDSSINKLPNEVIEKIILNMNASAAVRFGRTNHRFFDITQPLINKKRKDEIIQEIKGKIIFSDGSNFIFMVENKKIYQMRCEGHPNFTNDFPSYANVRNSISKSDWIQPNSLRGWYQLCEMHLPKIKKDEGFLIKKIISGYGIMFCLINEDWYFRSHDTPWTCIEMPLEHSDPNSLKNIFVRNRRTIVAQISESWYIYPS